MNEYGYKYKKWRSVIVNYKGSKYKGTICGKLHNGKRIVIVFFKKGDPNNPGDKLSRKRVIPISDMILDYPKMRNDKFDDLVRLKNRKFKVGDRVLLGNDGRYGIVNRYNPYDGVGSPTVRISLGDDPRPRGSVMEKYLRLDKQFYREERLNKLLGDGI